MSNTTKTYLRIKILSLCAEAKLIKKEQKRWIRKDGRKDHPIRMGLYEHRIHVVRPEARSACLAYGYLRGRKYKQLEAKCYLKPNITRVAELVHKYGAIKDIKKTREEICKWIEGA